MNLVSGGNDAGKSLLLAALPSVLFGVDHGSRLRSWGETLSCRVTVLFEGVERGVRLARDLETNLVRLEECGADGAWRDCFAAVVPVAGGSAERTAYFEQLERLFQAGGETTLRAMLDAVHAETVFSAEGHLAEGLLRKNDRASEAAAPVPDVTTEQRQQEIAALEIELATDRGEY
jgi:hypothetical protein